MPAPEAGVVVDPLAWFAAPGPLELEIGCGKGRFLLHRARSRPDVRLVGIEWANKISRYAADRMARWGVDNVRVVRTDASVFVQTNLPEACLTALHVYHPDPWPKKRHHKRRLFQSPFIEAAVRCTQPGGRWLIQTDHAEYFAWIRERLDPRPQLQEIEFDDPRFGPGEDWAGTNFEVIYQREGRPIHRVAYERRR
ncbi:MAG: tRNA (guanine-N(7)-)-methyltransferase [Phycisphaerae bacterium]|nr:tRNA (guanine-N(7)-)-methyltransferase [Phycisphaerae bacterium]